MNLVQASSESTTSIRSCLIKLCTDYHENNNAGTWRMAVTSRNRCGFIGEEDSFFHIVAFCDVAQGRRAVEPPVYLAAAPSTQGSRGLAVIYFSVNPE